MNKSFNQILFITISFCLFLSTSCGRTVVERDCGIAPTKILDFDPTIGAYPNSLFSSIPSLNFEEAAIRIEIGQISGVPNCFAWTPDPQTIEAIDITATESIFSGGKEYSEGESLNELFKLYLEKQIYSIPEFISAHVDNSLIYFSDDHSIVLQLLNKPDDSISQALSIIFTFDDSEILMVETSTFEVSN